MRFLENLPPLPLYSLSLVSIYRLYIFDKARAMLVFRYLSKLRRDSVGAESTGPQAND